MTAPDQDEPDAPDPDKPSLENWDDLKDATPHSPYLKLSGFYEVSNPERIQWILDCTFDQSAPSYPCKWEFYMPEVSAAELAGLAAQLRISSPDNTNQQLLKRALDLHVQAHKLLEEERSNRICALLTRVAEAQEKIRSQKTFEEHFIDYGAKTDSERRELLGFIIRFLKCPRDHDVHPLDTPQGQERILWLDSIISKIDSIPDTSAKEIDELDAYLRANGISSTANIYYPALNKLRKAINQRRGNLAGGETTRAKKKGTHHPGAFTKTDVTALDDAMERHGLSSPKRRKNKNSVDRSSVTPME